MTGPLEYHPAQPAAIAELLRNHRADLTWQRDFYQDLHRHPELSHHEERTAGQVRARLAGMDCEIVDGIGGHGMVAIFRSGEGPTVLLRADMDGLPVMEATGVDFASTNGAMHACGHDVHTTAALGACAIIDAEREHWSGTVLALFQPAEESSDGALAMVADGLTDRVPRPDVCVGQHVMPGPAGHVMSRPGPIMAGCDSIRITITGRSAHASMPHESVDPTLVAAMIILRLQAIVGREVPPSEHFVISVGELHAGDQNNIIPATAELVLNTRFYDPALAERVYAALRRVVEAECAASACPAPPTFEFFAHGEVTDNTHAADAAVRPVFDACFGEASVTATRASVSEDFSYLPQAWGVPYYFWFVGCTPADQLACPPVNHQPNFLPDYEPTMASATLAAAAAVFAFVGR